MTHDLVQRALAAPTYAPVLRRLLRQLLESLLYEGAVRTEDDSTIVGSAGVTYTFTARRRFTFDRVTVDELRREGEEPESVTRLLGELGDRLDADRACLARFARELEHTLLNDAVAQYSRTGTLAGSGFDELEGAITDGHRYHPAYKSRIGFGVADNLAYGPEFARTIRPLWLAAHRDLTEVSASSTIEEAEFLHGQLGDALTPPTPEFTLVPVHPWQWNEHAARAFSAQLRRGELVVLGEDPHAFLAQQSIRTLSCVDDPSRPYLKLAMSLVNTSTSRVLAPHTVHNAPLISDWLHTIAAADEFLRDEARTILLGEVLGAAVNPEPAAELTREDTYGTLACIWRESLHLHLDTEERAVPFTGLTARERDGTPLIDAWIRRHGAATWVRGLAEVAVLPLVHLLCRHGIALESHAQNMVLLHHDGVPTRVALRDFHDGVRFSRAHLAEPELCPPLRGTPSHHQNRNSFVETDDPALVADFMLDAFLFVNIGELAIFLADEYGLSERDFWAIVAERVREHLGRVGEARFDVFAPEIAVEKLTMRRLLPDTELRLHRVPNPLARV
ncbi:IucA/IucC family protein [Prauserella cavernicola]|uniref:Siderophore biosynthesis protein n=1 Tax=Prauserella cavernicola TaxID=2800127 RepID=A0A934QSA2_9PSEU|nr:IucA/IucC family protein [Prauserella cavernicola]MBK1785283.1 siderophore biosynthesis protein [Prauserella cavernicola]